MAQLFYIPAEDRVITRAGLAAEVEYIGGEYFVDCVIDDLLDTGMVVKLSRRDTRRFKAEDETRTVTIAQLFSVLDGTGAEDVLTDLRSKTDAELSQLSKAYL